MRGPSIFIIVSTDGIAWAHQRLRWVRLMPLYGPNTIRIISTNGVEWAQLSSVGAPDALSWAQQAPNYSHRQHWLGPALSSAGVTDALAWAQHTLIRFHR
jgi:hypothetical protein